MSSWDARLRRLRAWRRTWPRCAGCPGTPGTALVHRRPDLAGRRAGGGLAAADPARAQTARLADAGLDRAGRHRAGVHRLPGHLRAGRRRGLPRPGPGQPVQRGLLDPGHGPDRAAAAPDPQRDGRGRAVRRVGQGRVQPRPARDRVPLRRGGDHLRQPLDLQDRGEGDRGPGRACSITFMAKPNEREGNSCHIHLSLRGDRRRAGDGRGRRRTACRKLGRALPGRAARRACASWRCATRRTSTPTSATCRAASPRPRSAGARTTAPARCGWSATGPRCGWRTGCPAAT